MVSDVSIEKCRLRNRLATGFNQIWDTFEGATWSPVSTKCKNLELKEQELNNGMVVEAVSIYIASETSGNISQY